MAEREEYAPATVESHYFEEDTKPYAIYIRIKELAPGETIDSGKDWQCHLDFKDGILYGVEIIP